MKRAFIPKSLRPDVPGQYYQLEDEKSDHSETLNKDKCNPLALFEKNQLEIHDIKDYSFRKKLIAQIIYYKGQDEKMLKYKKHFAELFPNVAGKLKPS